MDLISDRGHRVPVEDLNTSKLLAHARRQADRLKLDDILVVDADSHHYEMEHLNEVLPFVENEVLKQLLMSNRLKGRGSLLPSETSFQDMGGGSLNVDWKLGPGRLTSTTAYRFWDWKPSNDRDFTALPITTVSAAPSYQTQWTQEVRWAGTVAPRLNAVVGAFYFRQKLDSDPSFVQEQGAAAARVLRRAGCEYLLHREHRAAAGVRAGDPPRRHGDPQRLHRARHGRGGRRGACRRLRAAPRRWRRGMALPPRPRAARTPLT